MMVMVNDENEVGGAESDDKIIGRAVDDDEGAINGNGAAAAATLFSPLPLLCSIKDEIMEAILAAAMNSTPPNACATTAPRIWLALAI